MAIRTCKEFLSHFPDQKKDFFHLASRGTGKPITTRGPTSALQGYFQRIGAQIDSFGQLHLASGLTLDILDTPFPMLQGLIRQEWMQDLLTMNTERTTLRGAPTVDRFRTAKIIHSFPTQQQKGILREMCHSFQLESKNALDRKTRWYVFSLPTAR